MVNVKQLVEWLGPDGAVAGLEHSDLTVAALLELARASNVALPKKSTRAQVIAALVAPYNRRITKSIEELLEMDQAKLHSYFSDVQPSRSELLKLLAEVDIRPPSKGAGSLVEFAVREISDIGMYRRVAKGHPKD